MEREKKKEQNKWAKTSKRLPLFLVKVGWGNTIFQFKPAGDFWRFEICQLLFWKEKKSHFKFQG